MRFRWPEFGPAVNGCATVAAYNSVLVMNEQTEDNATCRSVRPTDHHGDLPMECEQCREPGPAEQFARTMARTDVSSKGLGSGFRMIQYFINRAGKGLGATRRRELERATHILQRRRAAAQKA
jgi:Protein of unknown function (DUF3175)